MASYRSRVSPNALQVALPIRNPLSPRRSPLGLVGGVPVRVLPLPPAGSLASGLGVRSVTGRLLGKVAGLALIPMAVRIPAIR